MGLLNLLKTLLVDGGEDYTSNCCCGHGYNKKNLSNDCCTTNSKASATKHNDMQLESIHSIKVLGAGCKSCHEQYEYVNKAVVSLGLAVEVEYITDMEKVMKYGVISMPALVINESVVSFGKILKTAEIERILKAYSYPDKNL